MSVPPTLRLAVRSLARARATSVLAVLTLALGLGAAVALMGMIDAGVRPLPVPGGDRVVELELRDTRAERVDAPAPVHDWAAGQGIVEAGALRQFQATLVQPAHGAFRLTGAAMHPAVLRLLRVPAAVGRLPREDAADADALVLAWSVWQEMGADEALLGSTIRVDGVMHTLVGVMPDGFGFPEKQSFWTVLPADSSGEVVARVADGTDVQTAGRAAETRLNRVAAAQGLTDLPWRVTVEPWTTSRDNGGEGPLFIGLAALVALLLGVCAANVSTLLLVRGEERATQLAVHAAIGATRLRIGLQLFTEAGLLALAGGVLGLAGGFGLLRWMQLALAQHWGYYWMTMEVRLPVVLGTVVVMLAVTAAAGSAPALQAMRVDIARMLVSPGRAGHDRRRTRLGRWFVGAQVALSTLGLVVAVYLAWGIGRLDRVTAGLPMNEVAVAVITLPADRYTSPAERAALVAALRRELSRLPGVRAVSIGTALPGGPGTAAQLVLPSDARGATPRRIVPWDAADAELAATYHMRLVAGRLPDAADDASRAPVAVVSVGTARRWFDGNALGARLRLEGVHGDDAWAEVVGVVENWTASDDSIGAERVILPLAQVAPARLTLSVRAADPQAALPGIRRIVARIDRELPLDELQTLQARMDWFLRMSRVIAAFGMFGGLASVLVAAVGLYGVISFQVRTRAREIGVRMAVGADARRVVRLFLLESMRRVVPGLAVGFALALFAVPLVGRFAGGTGAPPDALLLGGVVLGMLAIGAMAALEPAVRAVRVDPQVVLRGD